MTRTPAVMEIELKPCPFCGGEALMHRVPWGWQVTCHDCGAAPRNNSNSNRETETEAGAVWNHRTPAEPLADGEMIEKVADIMYSQPWHRSVTPFAEMDARTQDHFRELARAAIAAYNPNDRLREALVKARAVLTNSQAESGYCMCGDPVASHSIGSGHSPVDSHIYMASQVIEEIDAALSHKD